MITKAQALTATEFHHGPCRVVRGARGGTELKQERWRRNGKTQTWVKRPNEWRVPIKHGMYDYRNIFWGAESREWHVAEDCPLNVRTADDADALYGGVEGTGDPCPKCRQIDEHAEGCFP